MRERCRSILVAWGVLLLGSGVCAHAADEGHDHDRSGRGQRLLVWAGDQARQAPDFLAVVDFDEGSPRYGKVLTTVPLPGPGETGNEPHHVGLSANGRSWPAAGSSACSRARRRSSSSTSRIRTRPEFLSSADPPESAITDEFYPLRGGGFLVTMMGGAGGAPPGPRGGVRPRPEARGRASGASRPTDGFNPHGISVRPELNLMVTSDFICPSTTLHARRRAAWTCAAASASGTSGRAGSCAP